MSSLNCVRDLWALEILAGQRMPSGSPHGRQRRTAVAFRRRAAPPHRHEGNLARRAARGLHRAHRAPQSRRSTRSPRSATSARARKRRRRRRRRCAATRSASCTGSRPASRTSTRPAGLLTTYGSPLYRDFVPERDNAMVARVRAAGAIVVGKTNVPEFGAGANSRNFVWGATGNPFDPDAQSRRLLRRLRRRARDEHAAACAPARTPAGRCAFPRRNAASSASGLRPASCRSSGRGLGWTPISVVGPMGRTVADTCLLMARAGGVRRLRSAVVSGRTGATSRCPSRATSARCASPTPKISIRRPSTSRSAPCSASAIGAMRHLFKSCDEIAFDYSARPTAAST